MHMLKRAGIVRAACAVAVIAAMLPTSAGAKTDALRRPLLLAAGALAGETFMTTCGAANTLAKGWQAGSFEKDRAAELAESYRQSAELAIGLIQKGEPSWEQARMLDSGKALANQIEALELWIGQNDDQARQNYMDRAALTDELVTSLTSWRLDSLDPSRAKKFDFDITGGTRSSGQEARPGQFTVLQGSAGKLLGLRWKLDDCTIETGIAVTIPGTAYIAASFGSRNNTVFAFVEDADGLTSRNARDSAGGRVGSETYVRAEEEGTYRSPTGAKLVVTPREDRFVDLAWYRPDGSTALQAIGIKEGRTIAAVHHRSGERGGVGLYKVTNDGTGSGRWLTSDGLSGTEEFSNPDAFKAPQVSDAAARLEEVRQFAELLRDDLANAARYRPTDSDIEAIAATAQEAELLRAYVDEVYSQIPATGSAAKPGQTEIIVAGPSLRDLPGGYSQEIDHFQEGVEIYSFKYVEPGKTSGMAYDGLIRLGTRWIFIPKAWRAFAQ